MNTTNTTNFKYYKYFNIAISLSVVFVVLVRIGTYSLAYAQVVYPIPELGNCTNIATCKVYCDQSENREACIVFAKAKGLSQKNNVSEKQVILLAAAKSELGCTTIAECKNLCEIPSNKAVCQAFAQKYRLASQSPQPSTNDEELLKAAKEQLRCESYDSCQRLCDEEKNYTKYAALMQSQVTSDERAMFEKYKPLIREYLDCDSIVTCMAFCINPLNTKKCQELAERIGIEQGGTPNIESPDPEVWCPKVSSECRWDGTNCVCQGPQTCAQSNDIPGCTWDGTQCNCPGIDSGSYTSEPGEVWCPKAGPYCLWDESSCTCWDPAACQQEGCTWTGSKCDCGNVEPEVWCPRSGEGCTWDGNTCTCPGTTGPIQTGGTSPEPGEVWCPRNPDCAWTGEVCQCTPKLAPQTEEPTPTPAVQGAATGISLLERIIQFFFAR